MRGRKNMDSVSDALAVPQVPICKMGTLPLPFPAAEAALGDRVASQVPFPICAALGKSPNLSESVCYLSDVGRDQTGKMNQTGPVLTEPGCRG